MSYNEEEIMKRKDIFNMNEIITIVMAEVESIELKEFYGIDEELHIPKPIESKLLLLDEESYTEFMKKVEEISKEIYELKSGELNELNKCHEEINIISRDILHEYIVKE